MRRSFRSLTVRSPAALALVAIAAVAALSGCIGGDGDPETSLACQEGEGVLILTVLEGAANAESTAWYEPANPSLDGIDTVCWVNGDTQWHRIIGMVNTVDTTPQWVHDAMGMGAPDPHAGHGGGGGHDHGSGGADAMPVVFDVEFMPADRLAMPVADNMTGQLMVHCHPHPWMASTWEVPLDAPADHPVEVGNVVYSGAFESDPIAVSESKEVKWDITAPNLARISAVITWADEDDTGPTGAQGNAADTLQVELLDPSGTVVMNNTKTGREGEIRIDHTIENAWPEAANGVTQTAAAAALATERPDDTSAVGVWTIKVTVVSAPGPIPDEDGTTAPIQSTTDGTEDFKVVFNAIHEFAKVLAPGASTMDGMTAANANISAS